MHRFLNGALIAFMGLAIAGCDPEDQILPTNHYYNVSGLINGNGSDIRDVIISDGIHSAVSDTAGRWTIYRMPTGTYRFTARKTGLTFQPALREVNVNGADLTGVDFTVAAGGGGGGGNGSETLEMVDIPAGTFMMGLNGDNDALPFHQVTVREFRMSKFEITQKEWQRVMETNPSGFRGENLPVERVTWYDAVAYCNELSQSDGYTPAYSISGQSVTWNPNANGYRLPTEAEWEHACRAGTATELYGYPVDNLAWYSGNSNGRTHPVGGKLPNTFGLYDMYGNIFEWCWDWRELYSDSPQTNPIGPASGTLKILRGGSWFFEAYAQKSGFRLAYNPLVQYNGVGFRVVRSAG